MGKRTRGQQIFAVFNALLMVLIIITCLLPLINVLAVSFSRQEAVAAGEVSLLPVGFTTVGIMSSDSATDPSNPLSVPGPTRIANIE